MIVTINTLKISLTLYARVLSYAFTCAGVAAEPVTKATDTLVAARRVVTATVAAGILRTLVDV